MSIEHLRQVHLKPGVRGWVHRHGLRVYARLIEWSTKLPLRRQLNIDRVSHWLLVGGHIPVKSYAHLKAMGVTHVIDMRGERQDDREALKALGIELHNVPVPDHFTPSRAQLEEAVRWGLAAVEKGGQVYAHCEHGVGRGPLMGLSMMVARGQDPEEAYRELRGARWKAALNDRQLEALADYAEQFKGMRKQEG
jgi:predicted protein tyrosine phosphatase